jgi:hypothetical protein
MPPPKRKKTHVQVELLRNFATDRVTGTCSVGAGDRVDPVVLIVQGISEDGAMRLGLSPADARWLAAELIAYAVLAKPTRLRGWRNEST